MNMTLHRHSAVRGLLFLAMSVSAIGCGTTKQEQLEAVAKDWCLTIRASQVIPVYPLTEDVQPGDVFLVETTVQDQQKEYTKRGFLPLDNHIARIDPSGYHDFYDRSFDPKRESRLPGSWQLAGGGKSAWELAPNAAFPTYSFSVAKGAGLNLAVPVSGVPVGLSLLGSQTANGSISIERARTMGVDIASAFSDLQAWAAANKTLLAAYGPGAKTKGSKPKKVYLRMITRIYATGKMDVALSDSRAGSAGLDVGVPRPVDLVMARPATSPSDVNNVTLENYRANLASLNAMLAESFKPTRQSGSNAGLDPAASDAKTKAHAELAAAEKKRLEEELKKQQDEYEKAKAALKEAGDNAEKKKAAEEALAAAQGKLDFRTAALANVGKILPGGSLRVTASSSRFIALQQEFDPPLVVGYLGFDVEIFDNGIIGAPVPSLSIIDPTQGARPETDRLVDALYKDSLPNDVIDTLEGASDETSRDAVRRLNALGTAFVPVGNPGPIAYEQGEGGIIAKPRQDLTADYRGFKAYVSSVLPSGPLARALQAKRDFKVIDAAGTIESVQVGSDAWKKYEAIVAGRQNQLQLIQNSPERRSAVREGGTAYLRLRSTPVEP